MPARASCTFRSASSLLGLLLVSDVASDAKQSLGNALGIANKGAFNCDPARLAGMRVIWWVHHPVFSVPDATGAPRLREGSIYVGEVVSVDEAPGLFDRSWRHGMSVHPGGSQVAFEVPGGKVRAERTQLGTIKGHLERHFALPPLGEQRSQNESVGGHHRHGHLSTFHPLKDRYGRIAKAA